MTPQKILLVFTGGTIGSVAKDGIIDVDSSTRFLLLELYAKLTGRPLDEFEVFTPLNLLSENLIPSDWVSLTSAVRERSLDDYCGIIITHGTDTLPYTSSVLSYAFSDLNIPVVLVSSNQPLDNANSNGLGNFVSAVDFIHGGRFPGVFVIYSNNRGESIVHLGSRLTEAFPFTHQFRSQKDAFFGTMENGKFRHHNNGFVPTANDVLSRTKKKVNSIAFCDEIMLIKPYPGLNYELLDFSRLRPKAILHDLYHSGTACTRNSANDGGRYSLLRFAERCRDHGIDLYLSPLSGDYQNYYATSRELLDCGATPLSDMTIEASIAKLSLAYGLYSCPVALKKFMADELFFEFILNTEDK
jgi:L-asparaginase